MFALFVALIVLKPFVLSLVGRPVTETSHPYHVGIAFKHKGENYWKIYCSGVILSPRWILSAAECTSDDRFQGIYKVIVGVHDQLQFIGNESFLHDVKRFETHPDYNRHIRYPFTDIGLYRLTKDITFDINAHGVKLPGKNDPERQNGSVYMVGYMLKLSQPHEGYRLRYTRHKLRKRVYCSANYGISFLRAYFCFGGQDSCSDWKPCAFNAGSGLIRKKRPYLYELIGIASHEQDCNIQ